MICLICTREPATAGVACETCIDELWSPQPLAPEQVVLQTTGATTRAAIVDRWGRAHGLPPRTVIGRSTDHEGVAIIEGSVSREHASLALEGDTWQLRDLGSSNGTFVDGGAIIDVVAIRHGTLLRFGRIAMFFITNVDAGLPRNARAAVKTIPITDRAIDDFSSANKTAEIPRLPASAGTIRFHQPSGGGGGFVEIDGVNIQLTVPQLELVELLVARLDAEADRPANERGFVSTTELMTQLSLVSPMPGDTHVRQVVLRLRRVFAKSGFGDLIESRYGVGYRIRRR